jgi:hypothetical protein
MADAEAIEPQGIVRTSPGQQALAGFLSFISNDDEQEHKISTAEIVLGFIWAAVLDLLGLIPVVGQAVNDIPVVDALGDSTFGFYLWYKGLPSGAAIAEVAEFLIELIPFVGDVWPGYIVGWATTIYFDRHPDQFQSTQRIASLAQKAKGKRGAAGAGAAGTRQAAQSIAKRARTDLPGLLRSVPQGSTQPAGFAQRAYSRIVGRGSAGEPAATGTAQTPSPQQTQQRPTVPGGLIGVSQGGPIAGGGAYTPTEGEVIPGEQSLFQAGSVFQEAGPPSLSGVATPPKPSLPVSPPETEPVSPEAPEEGGTIQRPGKETVRPHREEGVYLPETLDERAAEEREEDERIQRFAQTSAAGAPEEAATGTAPETEEAATPTQPTRETPADLPPQPAEPAPRSSIPVPQTTESIFAPSKRRSRQRYAAPPPATQEEPRELTEYEKALFESPVLEEIPEEMRDAAQRPAPRPATDEKKETPAASRVPQAQPRLQPIEAIPPPPPAPESPPLPPRASTPPPASPVPSAPKPDDEDAADALPKPL